MMMKYHFEMRSMKSIVLWILNFLLIGFLMWLPMITISKELLDLNSKIDKIVIFLDLNAEDEVGE